MPILRLLNGEAKSKVSRSKDRGGRLRCRKRLRCMSGRQENVDI